MALTGGMACAHHPPAPAKRADAQPAAHDPSPGAHTEAERTHVLEAQWAEVEVKGRKEGDAVVSAIKLVHPNFPVPPNQSP